MLRLWHPAKVHAPYGIHAGWLLQALHIQQQQHNSPCPKPHASNLRSKGCFTLLQGREPLYIASNKGHLEIMELLLAHGADIDAADHEVHTHAHSVHPTCVYLTLLRSCMSCTCTCMLLQSCIYTHILHTHIYI